MPVNPLPPLRSRRFVPVEISTLDDFLRHCEPHLALKVANKLSSDAGNLRVYLQFKKLADFTPEEVARQIEPLATLLELRQKLANLRKALDGNEHLEKVLLDTVSDPNKLERLKPQVGPEPQPVTPAPPPPPRAAKGNPPARVPEQGVWSRRGGELEDDDSILDEIVDEGHLGTSTYEREKSKDAIAAFLEEVRDASMVVRDPEDLINARVAQIEDLVSEQLNEVLHHPAFLQLEATWRGLHYLLRATRKFEGVKIKVLNISKKELRLQFRRRRASEFHDVQLVRKVKEQAGGTLGAEPFGLLIGDFTVGRGPEDAELIEYMAHMGAEAHVPFIAAVAPELVGVTDFSELTETHRLASIFESDEYHRWNSFRASVQSRYIGLVLPRMLLRLPYGEENPVESFDFQERGSDKMLWANALWTNVVWAFAAAAAKDFYRYGWFGATRDPDDTSALPDLPVYEFPDNADIQTVGPTDVAISDLRYMELRGLGLIPLCRVDGTKATRFFEMWSCHQPRIDPDQDPPTSGESAEIDCVLAVSRIAHYLTQIVRQERQRFRSVRECEEYLRKWVAPYLVPEYAQGNAYSAGFPLLDAEFRVVRKPDPRFQWRLEASLRPQRPVGTLKHPVEISIPLPLPSALTLEDDPAPKSVAATIAPIALPLRAEVQNIRSGRDRFLRKLFLAETCLADRKLDVATAILEDLTAQIERYHLEEWESPKLVSQVWDLLRRCYLVTSSRNDERPAALLKRICRLDPTRVIE
jgi:type VI secretion system protein ImpC